MLPSTALLELSHVKRVLEALTLLANQILEDEHLEIVEKRAVIAWSIIVRVGRIAGPCPMADRLSISNPTGLRR